MSPEFFKARKIHSYITNLLFSCPKTVQSYFFYFEQFYSWLSQSENLCFELQLISTDLKYAQYGWQNLKICYSQFFSLSEHNKHTKLQSQCSKIWRKSIFKYPVRFVKKNSVSNIGCFPDTGYMKRLLWNTYSSSQKLA